MVHWFEWFKWSVGWRVSSELDWAADETREMLHKILVKATVPAQGE